MISTKWFQGKENLNDAMSIRKKVFCSELGIDESMISDFYDEFAFSLVAYEDDVPQGTGRLLFKDGRFYIDMVCVSKESRGKNIGDLMVRMLVRKAHDMGAEKTYAMVGENCMELFEKVGFEKISRESSSEILMAKTGDVGGHCRQ